MKNEFMKLNIQLFADEGTNGQAVTQTENNTEGPGTEPAKKTETKTFTQEEVNAMVLKAEQRVSKKYDGVDLKKYKEWEESNKTNEEKYADILKENEKLKNDLAYAENISVVANAGVDSKFQKFVLSEVSTLEGDFNDNLTKYLKDNPQFSSSSKQNESRTTGMSQNGVNKTPSDNKAYLDKKYANNPYYKK